MGFMSKLLGNNKDDTKAPSGQSESNTDMAECKHGHLVPRWDNAADMGIEDRVSSYTCESCGASLSPAEAARVKAEEVQRLRV